MTSTLKSMYINKETGRIHILVVCDMCGSENYHSIGFCKENKGLFEIDFASIMRDKRACDNIECDNEYTFQVGHRTRGNTTKFFSISFETKDNQ